MNHLQTPHVLYILTKLELGGAQKICLKLMEGLQKQGESCSLISGAEGQLVPEAQKLKSTYLLKSFKREMSFFGFWHEIVAFIAMIRTIKKIREQHHCLVVHTHSTKAGIMGRWASWFAGVRIRIHTVHGYGFHDHQGWIKWMFIYLCELFTSLITTQFICVSKKDRDQGIRLFPGFSKKSSVIHAAVEWDTFYKPALLVRTEPAKKFIIGTVSCFKPQKNLFDLLKAFKQVYENTHEQKQVELHIVGDGTQRTKIESFITENGLQVAVKLLGWQNNVADIMKTWDLFTMSSLWEGLPCAIVEARLCKLPVVAYDVGGISEVIFNDHNGFLIEPGDWQALAEKIEGLINNQTLCLKLKNFHDNLWDFDDKVMVRKHQTLYRSLAQKYFCNL